MPSVEIKSHRNRKRTRSRLHLSSTSPSPSTPTPTPTSLHPLNTTTAATTRGPNSSSSDERNNKSPASSTSSLFDDDNWKRAVRIDQHDGSRDTVWWGYFLLVATWIVFVLGIGGSCGVWEWSLRPIRSNTKRVIKGDEALGMSGYYSSLMVLTGAVVAWIWVVFNWVGMKYFRHN